MQQFSVNDYTRLTKPFCVKTPLRLLGRGPAKGIAESVLSVDERHPRRGLPQENWLLGRKRAYRHAEPFIVGGFQMSS
jgi:hypothetical protein